MGSETGSTIPKLRLVGEDAPVRRSPLKAVPSGSAPSHRDALARRSAAAEMHAASQLSVIDARSLFAIDVAHAIEGGRAAILRPKRRRELVAAAVTRGLREFDANLIIAIVQDGVRHGETPLSEGVAGRLGLVREARAPGRAGGITVVVALAMLACWGGWLAAAWIAGR